MNGSFRRRIGLFPATQQPVVNEPAPSEEDPHSSIVAWGWYLHGEKREDVPLAEAAEHAGDGHGFLWLGLKDPTDADMRAFGEQFNLHPLAMEDAVEGHNRSKLEQFGDTLFMVVSTVAYVDHDDISEAAEIVSTGQVMVFVGKNFVLTVRRGEQSPLSSLRARLEREPERLAEGPSTVLYGVLDTVIDDYLAVVEAMEADVEDVEAAVFAPQGTTRIDEVYQLKREVIEFKRAVVPLGVPLAALANRDLATIPESARAYFRELSDHHTQVRESIASYDEVLTTMLQAALAILSRQDNDDMRKISAFVGLAAIPTMIAGIYGMNFKFMPELNWQFGYPMVLLAMSTIMLAMFFWFRHRHWL
ncbi:magnesium/cobalt transporter CorA [Enemella sp. A6]|uniref:magnesium/cobalt transporter CorA n=1 Tax=Enemella sp. A6 TaxID=3440152 RepID=UPI003EBB3F6B